MGEGHPSNRLFLSRRTQFDGLILAMPAHAEDLIGTVTKIVTLTWSRRIMNSYMKSSRVLSTLGSWFLLSFALAMIAVPNAIGASQSCNSFFTDSRVFQTENLISTAIGSKSDAESKIFPYTADIGARPNAHIMIGFESEYVLSSAEKLFEVYGPNHEKTGTSINQWLNFTFEQKLNWLKEQIKNRQAFDKSGVLYKFSTDPRDAFLPEYLIMDDTGNLEIVAAPVDTLAQFKSQVSYINRRFGPGSMQAMISSEKSDFYRGISDQEVKESVSENLGYYNFVAEIDVLERMFVGAQIFEQNPEKQVMRPFLHPYLGPTTASKQGELRYKLQSHAKGLGFGDNEKRNWAWLEGSPKYVGSTAYRFDIGGAERVSEEVRDAHMNEALLFSRVERSVFYRVHSRSHFSAFENVQALDVHSDFRKLSTDIQEMLIRLYKNSGRSAVSHKPVVSTPFETYRNFAYPLRNFNSLLAAMDRVDLANLVQAAQAKYTSRLSDTLRRLESGVITEEKAKAETQGALALFSKESGLFAAMKSWHQEHLTASQEWNEYWNKTVADELSFKTAFSNSNWRGPLGLRMAQFASRYPDNVRIVDKIRVQFGNEANTGENSQKKFLVISTFGMTEAAISKLVADYVNMVSIGTISFPMNHGEATPKIRIGSQFVENPIEAEVTPYSLSSNRRIEPIVEISPISEVNIRDYVEHASRSVGSVSNVGFIGSDSLTSPTRLTWETFFNQELRDPKSDYIAYWSNESSLTDLLTQKFAPNSSLQWQLP